MRESVTYTCARIGLALLVAMLVAVMAPTSQAVAPADTPAAAMYPALPSVEALDAFLAAHGSPMAGEGAAFVASGAAWGVDPRLLVAISGAESSFGQITCSDHNAWGWGCPNNPYGFASWAEGIDAVAKGLRTNYLADGLTSVAAIQTRYAPSGAANDPTGLNNHWVVNVSGFLTALGGDPEDVDLNANGQARYPVGPPGGTATAANDFGADDQPAADTVEIATGAAQLLEITLKNSGVQSWAPGAVRLRRVDDSPYVASAPIAALSDAAVAPGQTGTFQVQLVATGTSTSEATTSWQLEGPTGRFGSRVDRAVRIVAGAFAAADGAVSVDRQSDVMARAEVSFRNVGTEPWHRDGDGGVVLGIQHSTGPSVQMDSWLSPTVPARLLERTVLPGERGSFAFPLTANLPDTTLLELLPLSDAGWSAGHPVRLSVVTASQPR
jgi:hypothetical protein